MCHSYKHLKLIAINSYMVWLCHSYGHDHNLIVKLSCVTAIAIKDITNYDHNNDSD